MTLALIAGQGDLPRILLKALPYKPYICALEGQEPNISVDYTFRLETLGSLLLQLKTLNVDQVCFAGHILRPDFDPFKLDADTRPLVPQMMSALAQGDDGALRIVIQIFEQAGITVLGAHEIAQDLHLPAGVYHGVLTAELKTGAQIAQNCIAELGRKDQGQACIFKGQKIVATEDSFGTDAMMNKVLDPKGCYLFKAAKPQQELRADMPVIGLETVKTLHKQGFSGLVVEANYVMVLDQKAVLDFVKAHNLFFWVRERQKEERAHE